MWDSVPCQKHAREAMAEEYSHIYNTHVQRHAMERQCWKDSQVRSAFDEWVVSFTFVSCVRTRASQTQAQLVRTMKDNLISPSLSSCECEATEADSKLLSQTL